MLNVSSEKYFKMKKLNKKNEKSLAVFNAKSIQFQIKLTSLIHLKTLKKGNVFEGLEFLTFLRI